MKSDETHEYVRYTFHNPQVGGSIPPPATKFSLKDHLFVKSLVAFRGRCSGSVDTVAGEPAVATGPISPPVRSPPRSVATPVRTRPCREFSRGEPVAGRVGRSPAWSALSEPPDAERRRLRMRGRSEISNGTRGRRAPPRSSASASRPRRRVGDARTRRPPRRADVVRDRRVVAARPASPRSAGSRPRDHPRPRLEPEAGAAPDCTRNGSFRAPPFVRRHAPTAAPLTPLADRALSRAQDEESRCPR